MRRISQAEAREYYRRLYDKKDNIIQICRIDFENHRGCYKLTIVDDFFQEIDECIVRYTPDELMETDQNNSLDLS